MKRASVSDVSRRAGVSTATVSRVLNDPDKVSEVTRTKVLEAIEELDFVKSAAAFSLKSQQSNNVLVVVQNVGNIYYSEIFQGLYQRAEQSGYNIMITTPSGRKDHDSVIERLRTGRVDGVIVLDGYQFNADDYALLQKVYQSTPPIVGFAEKPDSMMCPHIYINNRKASRLMTEYLIGEGHRRIGHIKGPETAAVTGERLLGFTEAMQAAGLPVYDEDIFPGAFRAPAGRDVARQLARRRERPSAIFSASDEMAFGLISELHEFGISVPDDISVASFDDAYLADTYVPALTTIAQPRAEIGARAMDLLLDLICDPVRNAGKVIELQTTLIRRKSVARLK